MGKDIARFDCNKCTWGRHCDESNPAGVKKWAIDGVIESNICLKPMITERSSMFIRMYRHNSNGQLPFSGGFFDQPAIFIEACELIESIVKDGN